MPGEIQRHAILVVMHNDVFTLDALCLVLCQKGPYVYLQDGDNDDECSDYVHW
jgi:hypothetical protein